MVLLLSAPSLARANPAPVYDYVDLRDGTDLAVSIWYPPDYVAGDGRRWPTLFEMDGYGGARNVNDTQFAGRTTKFVVVYASIRGTGCSGGRFDLFSPQTAQDGRDVIENWIVRQPWSDGRVGITGHSYSGLTGLAVAQTAPPHLRAVAVSGLMDDLYRGLLNSGGVPNVGFPVVWAGAARPALTTTANGQTQAFEDRCRANTLEHQASDYVPSPDLFFSTYGNPEATEDSFQIQRGLLRGIGDVAVPTQVGHQWQDEQTGGRGGPVLWERLRTGLPKRLVLSNGRHNPNDPTGTKDEWLECWVIRDGSDCGAVTDPDRRVLLHLETTRSATAPGQVRQAPYVSRDFPAAQTHWRRWDLAPRTYASTGGDQHVTLNTGLVFAETTGVGGVTFAGDLPTQARWTIPFERDTVVAGPIALTLWATMTAADQDLFVDVLDRDTATGELRYLQRGLQRASLRRTDDSRADRVATGPRAGEVFRPYHPFTAPQDVPIGVPQRYEVEIFPLGHVFREGHELVLQVHAPPQNDPLSIGTFAPRAPAVVRILGDAGHRSSLLLPTLPGAATGLRASTCDDVAGELCLIAAGSPTAKTGPTADPGTQEQPDPAPAGGAAPATPSPGTPAQSPTTSTPPAAGRPASTSSCVSARRFRITLPRGLLRARATLDGRPLRLRRGRRITAIVDLRGQRARTAVVRVSGRSKRGATVEQVRRFRTCRTGAAR